MSTRREAVPRDPGTKLADIGDLVDFHGDRAVQPNGQFITNHEMNQIANFQDQIRNGFPARGRDRPSADGSNELAEEDLNRRRQLEQARQTLNKTRNTYASVVAENRIRFIGKRREIAKAKRDYDSALANFSNVRTAELLAQVESTREQSASEIATNRQAIEDRGGSLEQSLEALGQRLKVELKTSLMNMIGEEDVLLEGAIVQDLCAKSAEATRLSNLWARGGRWVCFCRVGNLCCAQLYLEFTCSARGPAT